MSFLRNIWTDLVEKRLWPVALLLVLALFAVPVLLASGEESTTSVATGTTGTTGADGTRAVVTLDPAVPVREDRKGDVRNPFKFRGVDPAAGAADPAGATPEPPSTTPEPAATPDVIGGGGIGGGDAGDSPAAGGSGGGLAPAPDSTPSAPPTTPAAPKPKAATDYRVMLRFGTPGTTPKARSVGRLTPLPSSDAPALVLLGVLEGEGRAVFLLSTDVKANGEGICKPRASSCETLELRKGDKELLDITGADGKVVQYQLELVRIVKLAPGGNAPTTGVAARTAAAKAAAKAKAAAAVEDDDGLGSTRYSFDAKTGRLRRVLPAAGSRARFRSAPSVAPETIVAFGIMTEALGGPGFGPSP